MTTLQTATSQLQASLPVFELYIVVFVAAAVICFASIFRTKQINQHDTRNGLIALLATSGAWALLQVAYLIAPTPDLKYVFYLVGLVVGLATVGPWLYFCSAYTGRSLHHNTTYQQVAVGVYLGIVAVKLTNPIHGLYFTSMMVDQPFTHLMINHGILHWLAMGVAYGLAVVGIFMLFELFTQVDYDTRPFVALIGLTALPVILDILGAISNSFVNIGYSALGVAVFAVGVLFIYTDRFGTIQLAGQYDDPVIVLDDDDEIRDFNRSAARLFPALEGRLDEPLAEVCPELAATTRNREVYQYTNCDETQYFRPTRNSFSANNVQLGLLLVLSDVTDEERYRRRLEAQNDRLEQFTGMVSHDLRNPLNVAQGNSEIIYELLDATKTDDGYEPLSDETLDTVVTSAKTLSNTLDRMERLIDDLLVLARQGQAIDSREVVSLAAIVENCWEMVDHKNAALVVDDDLTFAVDPDRLQQLFENLFRNAIEHGGDDVTIRVGALENNGFYVEDDGPGIPEEKREAVFDSGFTTNRDGTGFGLAIVKEIVEAHGWTVSVADSDEGGARFEVTDIETKHSDE
ncbi:histidine kinase (plasmid) [Halorubrum lacusprofundi ATCC 49239]|jgi:signal transduction histidine kinase|uniref:histidine kinase n=1 Tax=Halorubrum lacusprofundi (strain ATCC 49239 / DSM 5036 / JCM 8891 / ACAM 34) TaxID=416348 RepID=B9LXC1_HALLT|nr:ATP-binding protein [Halorubrum lacusprofundi]ACM59112.1 histidine kinase [Halorubrum lacusprofundi ATCC 49239]